MRRTTLRRKPQRDPVTPDVRMEVFERDAGCVLRFLEPGHVCRDQWGNLVNPNASSDMTAEHVKPSLAMSLRGPSQERWMVTLCWAANLQPPTKAQRAAFRAYLAALYPEPVPA